MFFHNQAHQNIPVRFLPGKFGKWDAAAFVQFHPGIQCQKTGQYIREAKSSENTSANGCQIPELYTDYTSYTPTDCTVCVAIQSLVLLQLPQSCHTTNGKFFLIFLDGIQSQIGQIDGCRNHPASHLQPQHASNDTVSLLLIQFIRLLQAFCHHVFFYFNHVFQSPLYS